MSLDLRAQSPELSIKKVENVVNALEVEDAEESDLEMDLAKMNQQTSPSESPNGAPETAAPTMGSLYSLGNANRRE